MNVSDSLKGMRSQGYGSSDKKENPSVAPRIIKLTEEEMKGIGGPQPGQPLSLTVHGTLEGDHFHVMSVEGEQQEESEEQAMAKGVADQLS